MFRKILVPTDGSELSDKAVQAAVDVAKQLNATIVGLSVAHPYPFLPYSEMPVSDDAAEYEKRTQDMATGHVEKVKAAAMAANVPCDTVVVKSFDPYKEITEVAGRLHCDAIFMASHSRKGLSRFLLGSQTQKVLAHTHIPVVVYR